MKIETNPVKIAYFNYIQLGHYLQECWEAGKMIERLTKEFTEEQLKQYVQLINGTITLEQISEENK
jgi:hypothetical protein